MSGIGVVGFSFALRSAEQEPNLCNVRLAAEVMRVQSKYRAAKVVTQWEITKALTPYLDVDHSVELRSDGGYLDSQGVWDEAKPVLQAAGITRVLVVAQPFLQLSVVKKMVAQDRFTLVNERIGRIGFDPSGENTQWWTRGPIRLVAYGATIKLGFQHGHSGRQSA